MDYYLGLKYGILQQHADAGTVAAQSAAQQAMAQARLTGSEADTNAARLPFIGAQAAAGLGNLKAQTAYTGAQTNNINQLTPAEVLLKQNQAAVAGNEADYGPARYRAEVNNLNATAAGTRLGNYGTAAVLDPLNPNLGYNGGQVTPFTSAPALGAFMQQPPQRRAATLAPNPLLTARLPGIVNNTKDDVQRVGGF